MLDTLRHLFARDLSRLQQEITLYQNEHQIWQIEKAIANSAGNLCLHLVGNLNTYIGAELGRVPYVRNREQEFAAKHVPRSELLALVIDTGGRVEQALQGLSEADLAQEYPLLVLETRTSVEYFLVHLATHLTYHLGQINYHRRLLDA